MKALFILLCAAAAAFAVNAAEYIVTPGDSLQQAAGKLKPGDTLTLRPGVYRQGTVRFTCRGTAAKPITIRGAEKDSTLVTAWVSLDNASWEAVEGQRFVYRTPLKHEVYSVADLKSSRIMLTAPSCHDMEKFRGTFRSEKGFLYLHAFDGKRPGTGLRATVNSGYLFLFEGASHVTVRNLTFCGSAHKDPRYSSWAIAIRCTKCTGMTVEKCGFLFNSGGVAFTVGCRDSVTRNCFFRRNEAPGYAEAAQLFFGGKSRNNLAENNLIVDTGIHGLRFYSGATDCTARNNIIVNARIGLYYKASAGKRLAERNVAVACPNTNYSDQQGGRPITDTANTFALPSAVYDPNDSNLLLKKGTDPKFCAPEYYDFRLQKDSPFMGKGAFPKPAQVLYLSASGSDAADGGSEKSAFRTFDRAAKALKSGYTLYIASGSYPAINAPLKEVTLRGRGNVELAGLTLKGSENVTVEGLHAQKIDLAGSQGVILKNVSCAQLTAGKGTRLHNCTFDEGTGDFKAFDCLKGKQPLGSFPESPRLPGRKAASSVPPRPAIEKPAVTVDGDSAFISWVTPDTSADCYRVKDDYWAPQPCTSFLEYGPTPALGKIAYSAGNIFHRVELTGLRPGSTWYARAVIPARPLARRNNDKFRVADFPGVRKSCAEDVKGPVFSFTTLPARSSAGGKSLPLPPHQTREYFVSPAGNDRNAGSRTAPFRTPDRAAAEARAGDTVTFLPGVYRDTITVFRSGKPGKPVTFRSAELGKAVFDGSNFLRPGGILCRNKSHIVFEGFAFRNFANKLYASRAGLSFGMAQILHSRDVRIGSCVFLAFGTYQDPVVLLNSAAVTVENCVLASGVSGITGGYNGNLKILRNTFYVSLIYNFSLNHFRPGSSIVVRNNLFVALTLQKALNCVNRTAIDGKGCKVDFDDNFWYFSPGDKFRFCGGAPLAGKPAGPLGLAAFRKGTGWGRHDAESTSIKFKGHTFYDPSDKRFDKLIAKPLAAGEITPTLGFFEASDSNKYGARPLK